VSRRRLNDKYEAWHEILAGVPAGGVARRLVSRVRLLTEGETQRISGAYQTVGKGTISSYSELDRNGVPLAIGIVFDAQALDSYLSKCLTAINVLIGMGMVPSTRTRNATLGMNGSFLFQAMWQDALTSPSNGLG
jgi:hypothetical protein